jgi:DNA-binding response OmpR family regulator
MSANAHIVVVDDEPDLRDSVATYLRRHGYAVGEADGGAALRALMAERPVDLVILDVNMPGEDGVSIARDLRRCGPIGIIMLTANVEPVDRVVGLEVGADDYVGKPFDLRELLARVRAVLRRVSAEAPAATMGREVRFGKCRLTLDSQRLFDLAGAEVAITPLEFTLLETFAANPNRTLTRERLLDVSLHGDADEPFDRAVDSRITRLRRKIETDPHLPRTLRTVRGAGYMFVPGED